MTTISASKTAGILITAASTASYTNPIVINAGVTITRNVAGPADAFAAYAGFWTLDNKGTIASTNPNAGVYLLDGGSVTNATSAPISGAFGVEISFSPAAVVNDGSIVGNARKGAGVWLERGGYVGNRVGASIGGAVEGVHIQYYAGTVINGGTIAGTSATYSSFGLYLDFGGTVNNKTTGLVEGDTGVKISGDVGTVVNSGKIIGTAGYGIDLEAGGRVINAVGASINGSGPIKIAGGHGTVVNSGSIGGYVTLLAGGLVTNATSATIGAARACRARRCQRRGRGLGDRLCRSGDAG